VGSPSPRLGGKLSLKDKPLAVAFWRLAKRFSAIKIEAS
jgi:hypothetical protein